MTRNLNVLLLFIFVGCSRNVEVLDGQYIAINDLTGDAYATIDIQDSIVELNKYSVFVDERDTIIINPKNNKFIGSTRILFPIYDFRAIDDTVYISYAYDSGEETVKFVRKEVPPRFKYFAESSIDIQLRPYKNEKIVSVELNKVRNLIIGKLKKDISWPETSPDSILLEFERFDYLGNKDLPELIEHLELEKDPVLCLHFDKRVPMDLTTAIRTEIQKTGTFCDIVESRINETELVYIK
jgi:hypothetical protein